MPRRTVGRLLAVTEACRSNRRREETRRAAEEKCRPSTRKAAQKSRLATLDKRVPKWVEGLKRVPVQAAGG
jgi:hypothetical protein